MANKSIIFYVVGGVLSVALLIYVVFLVNVLVSNISVVSGTNLLKTPEIATYNFARFQQIKGAAQ